MLFCTTSRKMPRISAMNDQIDAFTRRLSVRVYRYLERRVERAYPAVQPVSEKKEKTETGVFAEGCSFYKIVSSLHHRRIFGRYYRNHILPHHRRCLDEPQQPCLGPVQHRLGPGHRPRYLVPLQLPRPLRWIPVCLWYLPRRSLRIHLQCVHRIVFGKVFWDYSDIPFNLGGRINLLYCFFWGIAAVVWLKKILSCHFALD